jgi:hypothetical protein
VTLDDDDLEPRAPRPPTPDPDSPIGHIVGRDKRLYAGLWAPAYVPGWTAADLLDDDDPEERESGEQIFAFFVREMEFDHSEEEYRRVVELPKDHPDKIPWGGKIDLEDYAARWRPLSHAGVVRFVIEAEKAERLAHRSHLKIVR